MQDCSRTVSMVADHLPFHRGGQETLAIRCGDHGRATCGWMRQGAELLTPRVWAVGEPVLESKVVSTDGILARFFGSPSSAGERDFSECLRRESQSSGPCCTNTRRRGNKP